MPLLPASYVTGRVIFNALRSLGDIDGDGLVNWDTVSGEITFMPDKSYYVARTTPRVVVGHEPIISKVVAGELVSPLGSVGESLPVGRWRVSFNITGLSIPATTIDVLASHTALAPLDIGKRIPRPSDSTELDDKRSTGIIITDTADGGYRIVGQEFLDEFGALSTLIVEDNGDGSITFEVVGQDVVVVPDVEGDVDTDPDEPYIPLDPGEGGEV